MAFLVILLQLITFVTIDGDIQNTCPDKVLWTHVARETCPNNPHHYHCLEGVGKVEFEKMCKVPVLITKGIYPVLDVVSHNVDAKNCPIDRYQPVFTYSNERNTCEYQKTTCNEEGQLIHSNGTSTDDRLCTCDYRHGYIFVQTPVNTRYCVPSQEDCSCFKRTCDSYVLNKGYQLLAEYRNTSTVYNCNTTGTITSDAKNKANASHNKDYDTQSYNVVIQNIYARRCLAFSINIVLLYIISMMIILRGYYIYNDNLLTSEVHKQRTINLVIIGPEKSGKTSVWCNLLGIKQEKSSHSLFQKYCISIRDGQLHVLDFKRKVNSILKAKKKSQKTKMKTEEEVIHCIVTEIPGTVQHSVALAPFVSSNAIFIFTTDVNKELNTYSNYIPKDLEWGPKLNKDGELIREWLYIVHSLKPAEEDSSTSSALHPSIVVFGTHKDKCQDMTVESVNKKLKEDVYNCVHGKKNIIKKHEIFRSTISNEQTQSKEIQELQKVLMKESDEGSHDEVPVRYYLFEEIMLDQRSKTPVMSFDEVVELGEQHGYPVTDKQEFRSFLLYQHKVRNIIYWEDIPEYIVITPVWLYGIIGDLISTFHKEAKSELSYGKTGGISKHALIECIGQSTKFKPDIIDVLQKYELIVCINKKFDVDDKLYVPFVIPESHTADVVSKFETNRRNKTSFLSFSFDVLPSAFVNHIMIRLTELYTVCDIPSQNGEVAIYYRTLVLDYNSHNKQKLYFLSLRQELLFQIWSYESQQISDCFKNLRDKIDDIITEYKKSHKLSLHFKYKLKCQDSEHSITDAQVVEFDKPEKTYYCDHIDVHEELSSFWFTRNQEGCV